MGRNDTDFEKRMREASRTADELYAQLDQIRRKNKTDTFAIAIVFMTLGLCGLGALAVTVFAGGGV